MSALERLLFSAGADPTRVQAPRPVANLDAIRRQSEVREARRARVVAELQRNPALSHSWLASTNEDGTVTLTVAVRGVGSAELTVEAGRFDPFKFVEVTGQT